MINPTLEFLTELVGKKVLVTKSFLKINPGSKIVFKNFETNENEIIFTFEYKKNEVKYSIGWKDNIPFINFSSAKSAYFHAKRVKKRFNQEIEDVVFKNSPKLLYLYAISFIKERFPENLEKIIVQNPYYAFKYAKNYLDQRLSEEQEKIFLKDKTGESLAFYALEVVKSKLPEELHNFLLLKSMDKKISSFTKNLINKYFKIYCSSDSFEIKEEPVDNENLWIFNKIPIKNSLYSYNNNMSYNKIYKIHKKK